MRASCLVCPLFLFLRPRSCFAPPPTPGGGAQPQRVAPRCFRKRVCHPDQTTRRSKRRMRRGGVAYGRGRGGSSGVRQQDLLSPSTIFLFERETTRETAGNERSVLKVSRFAKSPLALFTPCRRVPAARSRPTSILVPSPAFSCVLFPPRNIRLASSPRRRKASRS